MNNEVKEDSCYHASFLLASSPLRSGDAFLLIITILICIKRLQTTGDNDLYRLASKLWFGWKATRVLTHPAESAAAENETRDHLS